MVSFSFCSAVIIAVLLLPTANLAFPTNTNQQPILDHVRNNNNNVRRSTVVSEFARTNPKSFGSKISSVAYGNGVMVAFGLYENFNVYPFYSRGQFLVSFDVGESWMEIQPLDNVVHKKYNIIFMEKLGKFVAVPLAYDIDLAPTLISVDGITWTAVTSANRPAYYNFLVTNGSVMVATTFFQGIFSSNDGISWKSQQIATHWNDQMKYLPSLGFVLFGGESHILVSKTGEYFEVFPVDFFKLIGIPSLTITGMVESEDGILVLIGTDTKNFLLLSQNKQNWTLVYNFTENTRIYKLDYYNGMYSIVATFNSETGSSMHYSKGPSVGWNFQKSKNALDYSSLYTVAGNMWIATNFDLSGILQTSYDGISWITHDNGISNEMTSVYYSDILKTFVVGSIASTSQKLQGYVFQSSDGISWNSLNIMWRLSSFDQVTNTFLGISQNNTYVTKNFKEIMEIPIPVDPNRFYCGSATMDNVRGILYVVCSVNEVYGGLIQGRLYSRNITNSGSGNSWNLVILPTIAYQVIYEKGTLMYANTNAVYTSRDYGRTWSNVYQSSLYVYNLRVGVCGPTNSQKFFICSSDYPTQVSSDGITWNEVQGGKFISMNYFPQIGFIGGANGNYSISSDGIHFSFGGLVTNLPNPLIGMAKNNKNDTFVVVSNYESAIYVSHGLGNGN